MKRGFLNLLESIKLYSTYYFTIITIIGVMWGAFAAYHKWKDSNDTLQKNVNTIMTLQESQRRADSLLLKQQNEMQSQLNIIQGTTESLEDSYVKYLTRDKSLTKEDFLDYMEGLSFDVKKNSLRGQAESNPPLLIQQELTQKQLMKKESTHQELTMSK